MQKSLVDTLSALLSQEGGARKALELMRKLDSETQDEAYVASRGGFLIDIGTDLGDEQLITEGIAVQEQALSQCAPHATAYVLYNIANGLSSLGKLRRVQGQSRDVWAPVIRRAVKHYYASLGVAEGVCPPDFLALIWCNCGNSLADLGRSVEAMSAYAQALRWVPDHPLALGNYGIELRHFANVAGHARLLLEALSLLERACRSTNTSKLGGPAALAQFRAVRDALSAQVGERFEGSETEAEKPEPKSCADSYLQGYVHFCTERRLFLNLCQHCGKCPLHAEDTVSLSLTTKLDDDSTFPSLASVVNEVKERYATARFLLYTSLYPPVGLVGFDELTPYVDNLDYAVYGIRVGLVKASFETAYNVLDKIAWFINNYLALGVAPRLVSFTTIWRARGGGPLRQPIADSPSRFLHALYDVACDLKDGQPPLGDLSELRNFLTHRCVRPHVETMHWTPGESETHESYHLSRDHLCDAALTILSTARAAIIYLVAFIDQEEARRHPRAQQDFVLPEYVDRFDSRLYEGPIMPRR